MSRGKMSSVGAKDVGRRAKWRTIDSSPPSASRRVDEQGERKHWSDTSHPTRYPDSCLPRVSCLLAFTTAVSRHSRESHSLESHSQSTLDALFLHSFNRVIWTSASTRCPEIRIPFKTQHRLRVFVNTNNRYSSSSTSSTIFPQCSISRLAVDFEISPNLTTRRMSHE
jgi:hypothetical protein